MQVQDEQAAQQKQNEDASEKTVQQSQEELAHLTALTDNGREVTVVGVTRISDKKPTYIIAGSSTNLNTGEVKPVAVRIDDTTTMIKRTGEHVSPSFVLSLLEGEQLLVEGKKSKRGVIQATRVLV